MVKLICKKALTNGIYDFVEGEMYYGSFDKKYNFHSTDIKGNEYISDNQDWNNYFKVI